MPMKPILKRSLIIGGTVIGVVIVLLVLSLIYSNLFLRKPIEKTLSYVLQVDVKIGLLRLMPLRGRAVIHDLVIGNPQGFKEPSAIRVGQIDAQADVWSFFGERARVDHVIVREASVTMERAGGGWNLGKIIDSAGRFSNPNAPPPPPEQASSKKISIKTLEIDGAAATVAGSLLPPGGVKVAVGKITLRNLGTDEDSAGIAAILSQILSAFWRQLAASAGGLVPEDALKSLNSALDSTAEGIGKAAGDLKRQGEKVGEALKANVEKAGKEIDSALKDAGKDVGEALKGVGGLLRKPKD